MDAYSRQQQCETPGCMKVTDSLVLVHCLGCMVAHPKERELSEALDDDEFWKEFLYSELGG